MKRGAWHDFGGQHPWHSIDQDPPKLAWPNAPGWPPADAIGPAPEPRPFAPELPVTVNDEQDEWHGRDGVIIGQPADERGLNQDGRWDVGFEGHDGKANPTQRRVYREDQLRRR